MARCVVRDVELNTTGDLVVSLNIKEGFELCSANVDAIRKHDAEARGAPHAGANISNP